MTSITGIHHVTAITGDAQQNLDVYAGVLGLRLVKKTVNFDDPGSYHLYYGDRIGSPGTLVTFFEWPGATRGKIGIGEPISIVFAVPPGSLAWWSQRLGSYNAQAENDRLVARDPEGLSLEFIETAEPSTSEYWAEGGVPQEYAIKGIHAIVLALGNLAASEKMYVNELGFVEAKSSNERKRYQVGASTVEALIAEVPVRGRMGAGSIHHVAFRVPDDGVQREWLEKLNGIRVQTSDVMDRKYFHSVYFREPGGVLFEIATDNPGMAVDEPVEHLGENLALPAEYEQMRPQLEKALTPIQVAPASARA